MIYCMSLYVSILAGSLPSYFNLWEASGMAALFGKVERMLLWYKKALNLHFEDRSKFITLILPWLSNSQCSRFPERTEFAACLLFISRPSMTLNQLCCQSDLPYKIPVMIKREMELNSCQGAILSSLEKGHFYEIHWDDNMRSFMCWAGCCSHRVGVEEEKCIKMSFVFIIWA